MTPVSGRVFPESTGWRRLAWRLAGGLVASAALLGTAGAQTTFSATGAVQTYTVPAGAGGISISAKGAGGGGGATDAPGNGGAGGAGATASGIYHAAPGTVVNVFVGGPGILAYTSTGTHSCTTSAGAGGNAGGAGGFAGGSGGQAGCSGYSGGGAGGGAASVVSTAANSPLVIAGGGGGGQGGALNVVGKAGLNSTAFTTGTGTGSAGAAGLTTTDGGGGGGGGGGCPGGTAGGANPDSQASNTTVAAPGGTSCSAASVTGFAVTGGTGGAGGAGGVGNAVPGVTGTAGSVTITPLYPTLNLVKSAPSPALQTAANSVYTLTVSTASGTTTPAYRARVLDQLPATLTYVSGVGTGWTCTTAASGGGTLVTCDFVGTIAAGGGTASLAITVTPTSTTSTITNYAAVGSTGTTTVPTPTTCTAANAPTAGCAAPVSSSAVLGVVKSAPSPALKVGSSSVYTLTVTNTGTASATTARVVDQLPANLGYVSGAGTNWACSSAASGGGTLVTCNYTGTIAAGGGTASALTITVTPTTAAATTNYAAVDASGGTAPPTPTTCTAANAPTAGCAAPVSATPTQVVLGLVKSAPSPTLQIGSNSTYVLTVTNSGTAASATARVLDQLPATLSYVSASGTGWTCAAAASGGGTLVTCDYSGTLAAGGGTAAVSLVVTPNSTVSVTNYASVDATGAAAPPTPATCTAANAPSAGCAAPVTTTAGSAITGTVYSDANHNSSLDAAETGIAGLYIKLTAASGGTCSSPALAASAVTGSSGAYTLSSVTPGSYCLIVTNSAATTNITPFTPAGFIGTQNPGSVVQLTVTGSPSGAQNFGFYSGSTLAGTVFADVGSGSGTANNGVKDGSEAGLAGVSVSAMSGATQIAAAITAGDGSYLLWIPPGTGSLTVAPAASAGVLATGGTVGTTGGTYTRPSLVYTPAAGASYSGANFGQVPPNTLGPNGAETAQPGTTLYYAHTFVAGSGGSLSLSLANVANPVNTAWSETLYRDTNCNAQLDTGEPVLAAPVTVTAGQNVCVIVKEFVPATAAIGAINTVTLSAAFTYTNASPALSASASATDVTTVGQPGVLALSKLVSNTTQGGAAATSVNASPGNTLQYSLTAVNNGSQPLSTLFINDATPAFTTYLSAACPATLPTGISACTVSTQPSVGGQGGLQWTFTGSLSPTGQLLVTYQVKVNQ